MTTAERDALCALIDSKIDVMEEINKITVPLVEEDFDELGGYFEKRAEYMSELGNIFAKEREIIKTQKNSETLGKLFSLKELDKNYEGDEEIIARKLRAQKIIYDRIIAKEKLVEERLSAARESLEEEFDRLNKTKQVVDYMETTAKPVIVSGNKLDMKL